MTDFSIVYQKNQLFLQTGSLKEKYRQYLEAYLAKVNRYKIIGFHEKSPVFSLYQPSLSTAVGIRYLQMRLLRRFENCRRPATATISVTNACPCDCIHCSAYFYNRSSKKNLSMSELKLALIQTVRLGATTIILLGGEPLLRKDIFDLISSVPKESAIVILFTNGENLTPVTCRRLKQAGLMGAFVSLDSANEEEHDRLRRRHGLFTRALIGLSNMQDAGMLAGISSYLSPRRLRENGFQEMMELAKKVKACEVTFFDAIPSGRWLKDTSCLLTPGDRIEIRELVLHYRFEKNYPGLSVQSTMTSECGSAFCFAANTQFYLTASGEMCPCDFTPLTAGRFPDQSIADLWNKMITTPPYNERAKSCRMQDAAFRKKFIETIPPEGPYPFPLNFLDGSQSI